MKAARHAYKTTWGQKVSAYERGRLLYKLADLLEQHAEELTALEAIDAGEQDNYANAFHPTLTHLTGKTHSSAKWDIDATIQNFRYYAGWADKNFGKTIEVRLGVSYANSRYQHRFLDQRGQVRLHSPRAHRRRRFDRAMELPM